MATYVSKLAFGFLDQDPVALPLDFAGAPDQTRPALPAAAT